MVKWRLQNEGDDKCDCGEPSTNYPENICSMDILIQVNQNAIDLDTHWLQYNT